MSKFDGADFMLSLHDRKADGNIGGKDKPEVTRASKQTITDSAMSWGAVKGIPLQNRFSTRMSETPQAKFRWRYVINKDPNAGQFSLLGPESLVRITEKDKLFIFGHGNSVGIAWMSSGDLGSSHNANSLAQLLYGSGLRRVGLITFKACYVGRADFLKQFAMALAGQGIAAGWLKGYKGIAKTNVKAYGSDGEPTAVIEVIKDKDGNVLNSVGQDVVNNERYRIVRGPGRLFEGKSFGPRYHGTTTAADASAFAQAQQRMADLLQDE
jgi:nitrogen regulatory protein PII-like uncharacterized protein